MRPVARSRSLHLSTLWLACAAASCSSAPARPNEPYEQTDLLNKLAVHPPASGVATPSPGGMIDEPQMPSVAAAEQLNRDIPSVVMPGQDVSFGVDVVQPTGESVRVTPSATEKPLPDGATFDQRTLTVRWRVPRAMTGEQTFHFTTSMRDGAVTHDFEIKVQVVRAVGVGGVALTPTQQLISKLVTITDPRFLARTQADWTLEKLLEVARNGAIDALPEANRAAVTATSGRDLLKQLLADMAKQHKNERLDPNSPRFDHKFDSRNWKLVAVRPRIDKHVEELRLAFQAATAEPVFIMFRFRLFRGPYAATPALAEENNKEFTKLFHAAFFANDALKPAIQAGAPAAMNTAVAAFVRSVLTYKNATNPALRVGLVAIPQEARLGGGSTFDEAGNYQSGTAWAFTVGNVKVPPLAAGATRTAVTAGNVPVSAFTFDIAKSDDGSAYVPRCPDKYRSDEHMDLRAMCEPDGNVRITTTDDAGVAHAITRDSNGENAGVAFGEMLGRVPLTDPRRRAFEENGMTCVQCHMRNFDDGVMSEAQVEDPRVTDPITAARVLSARVAVQVLPVRNVSRSPWFLGQEAAAMCGLNAKIKAQLGITTTLPCPEGY